MKKIQRT